MTTEQQLLGLSLLTAVVNSDKELIETVLEIDEDAGAYAVSLSLGMIKQLIHAPACDASVGLPEVIDSCRRVLTNEL